MDADELTQRIEAALDQAVERRDRLFRQADEHMGRPVLNDALAGLSLQIASSAETAVIRALSAVLGREAPPPPA